MKYVGKFNTIVFLLIVLAFGLGISRVGDDILSVGKKNSSADKILYLGPNRLIRSNESTGQLEFSNNNGASYLNVGELDNNVIFANLNEIVNGDAENGTTPWTTRYEGLGPVPLTVTTELHNEPTKNYGQRYFRIRNSDSALDGDSFFEQEIELNTAYKLQECVLDYSYLSNPTYGNDFTVRVLDQSGVIIVQRNTNRTNTNQWLNQKLEFPCGNNNTLTVSIRASCAEFCAENGFFEDLLIDNIKLSARPIIQSKFYYKSWILPTNPPAAYQFLFDTSANFAQISSAIIGLQTNSLATSKLLCADGSTGSITDVFGVNSCSISGTLGISIVLPRAARYEVCTKFNYFTNNVADEGVFQLQEQTGLSIGSDPREKVYLKAAATASAIGTTMVCEQYNFTNIDQTNNPVVYPYEAQFLLTGRRIGASAGNGIEVYMNTTSDYDSYMYWTVKEL